MHDTILVPPPEMHILAKADSESRKRRGGGVKITLKAHPIIVKKIMKYSERENVLFI